MIEINEKIAKALICQQFPQWKDLPVKFVARSGHDNRTFHLGDKMILRLPSADVYSPQIDKESEWLPKISPYVSLPITKPIAKGKPSELFPFAWSVNLFLEGESACYENIADLNMFATKLALFLKQLQSIDTKGAPKSGTHNFCRGGDLATYHEQTLKALDLYKDILPVHVLSKIWEDAIKSKWEKDDVWIHGDIAPGNLLVKNGELCGVIDFGLMAVGDPACDYAIAWTFFDDNSKETFIKTLECDIQTVNRSRGWALWKALITYNDKNRVFSENARFALNNILNEQIK